ncbi:hypothetical protein ANCCAN_29648 [Ancylostoma caninum]|uniref:Uncharacterized protein n=1 Tax=Ancylostoma caninum TaxID=29170 RepID=A0A368EXY7_ANCCA|nr:hypothetical protein ANCCAN_29648 [Ancylostoma caninum]
MQRLFRLLKLTRMCRAISKVDHYFCHQRIVNR